MTTLHRGLDMFALDNGDPTPYVHIVYAFDDRAHLKLLPCMDMPEIFPFQKKISLLSQMLP